MFGCIYHRFGAEFWVLALTLSLKYESAAQHDWLKKELKQPYVTNHTLLLEMSQFCQSSSGTIIIIINESENHLEQ